MPAPIFDQIDTVVLPVRNYEAAVRWYAAALGLEASFTDPDERLAVLPLSVGSSVTLWEQHTEMGAAVSPGPTSFPIFATKDAAAAWEELRERGVRVGELQEGPGVRFFDFYDLDGNRLEACQVAEAPLSSGA